MLVLVAALLIPTFVSASDSNQSSAYTLQATETAAPTDKLSVEVQRVSVGGNNATVSVINQDTQNTTERHLNSSETKPYVVDNETVNVTLQETQTDSEGFAVATITVEYSPYFGWNSGARLFFENLGLVFALLGAIMILGTLAVATRW